jgi:HPt (histidine-containing phosphotransfer) domain-containing protein
MAQAKGELQQAWEQHDWGQLRKTAHAIKGMGASYGQPEMTRYGALLQEHAVGQNRESCAQWVEQLIRLCSRAG